MRYEGLLGACAVADFVTHNARHDLDAFVSKPGRPIVGLQRFGGDRLDGEQKQSQGK